MQPGNLCYVHSLLYAGVSGVLYASSSMSHTLGMPCRQQQEVNSTVSAKSLAAEVVSLTKHGAEYAAQGVNHIQKVGLTQVFPTDACMSAPCGLMAFRGQMQCNYRVAWA